MSDDKAQQQEPSMEDILASIRRILSEDDAEEAAKAPPPAEPPQAEGAEFEPEPEPSFEMEPELPAENDEDVLELTDDMVADDDIAAPEEPVFEEPVFEEPEPEPEPMPFHIEEAPVFKPAPMPEEDDEPEESLLSPPVQAASTTALAELARAVAQDRNLGVGNAGITLEELVREILKPLIKDWLDQNLPYMIERIVKKEIEKMVNRAEKL